MMTRPFVGALVGSILLACGSRADLLDASPGSTKGNAAPAHRSATVHDAGAGPDANGTAAAEGVAAAASVAARTIAGFLGSGGPSSSPQRDDGCANIDLSAFDRSCSADSDCMSVSSGMACPSGCFCPNDAINVDERKHYEQTVASLPFSMLACPCPSGPMPNPVCTRGVCTY